MKPRYRFNTTSRFYKRQIKARYFWRKQNDTRIYDFDYTPPRLFATPTSAFWGRCGDRAIDRPYKHLAKPLRKRKTDIRPLYLTDKRRLRLGLFQARRWRYLQFARIPSFGLYKPNYRIWQEIALRYFVRFIQDA